MKIWIIINCSASCSCHYLPTCSPHSSLDPTNSFFDSRYSTVRPTKKSRLDKSCSSRTHVQNEHKLRPSQPFMVWILTNFYFFVYQISLWFFLFGFLSSSLDAIPSKRRGKMFRSNLLQFVCCIYSLWQDKVPCCVKNWL